MLLIRVVEYRTKPIPDRQPFVPLLRTGDGGRKGEPDLGSQRINGTLVSFSLSWRARKLHLRPWRDVAKKDRTRDRQGERDRTKTERHVSQNPRSEKHVSPTTTPFSTPFQHHFIYLYLISTFVGSTKPTGHQIQPHLCPPNYSYQSRLWAQRYSS